jgi:hypothetical protein
METLYPLSEKELIPPLSTNYEERNFNRVRKAWEERLSKGLIETQQENLSPIARIGRYLQRLKESDPEYFSKATEIAEQLPPMNENAQVVVLIPIVGFGNQAEKTIPGTLKCLTNQNNVEIEIFLLVNKPPGVNFDNTPEIIAQFPNPPNAAIIFATAEIPIKLKSRPPMGLIRGLQIDAILIRIWESLKNSPEKRPPIIVLADDDVVWANPNALVTYLKAFEENPSVDLILGPVEFDSEKFPSIFFPGFAVANKLMALLPSYYNKLMLNQLATLNRPLTNEEIAMLFLNFVSSSFTKGVLSNIAFRPEAYAAVGGAFDRTQDVNELDFMVRMFALRGILAGWCNILALDEGVEVVSNSRRALLEYIDGIEGLPPIQQWRGDWEIKVLDPARIQTPNIFGVIPLFYCSKKQIKEVVEDFENQINSTFEEFRPRIIPGWWNEEEIINNVFKKALAASGLLEGTYTYSVTFIGPEIRFQIRITDASGLLKKIAQEQQRLLEERGLTLSTISVEADRIEKGVIVRPKKENSHQSIFLRDDAIYEKPPKSQKITILKLPI